MLRKQKKNYIKNFVQSAQRICCSIRIHNKFPFISIFIIIKILSIFINVSTDITVALNLSTIFISRSLVSVLLFFYLQYILLALFLVPCCTTMTAVYWLNVRYWQSCCLVTTTTLFFLWDVHRFIKIRQNIYNNKKK